MPRRRGWPVSNRTLAGGRADRVRSAAAWVLALVLAVVFVLAAIPKLKIPAAFLGSIYEYGLIGPPYARWVAAGLPWLELMTAAALVFPSIRRSGAVLAGLLCAVFVGAQLTVVYRGLYVSCACFGSESETIGYYTLARSAVFLLIAVAVYLLDQPIGARWERTRDPADAAARGADGYPSEGVSPRAMVETCS